MMPSSTGTGRALIAMVAVASKYPAGRFYQASPPLVANLISQKAKITVRASIVNSIRRIGDAQKLQIIGTMNTAITKNQINNGRPSFQ